MDEPISQPPNSQEHVTSSFEYNIPTENRLVAVLYKKVEEMEQKIHELETKKIIDETQFPLEVIESNGLLPQKPLKLMRGKGYRPILQSEIQSAKNHSPFVAQQAKFLGIHLTTYKKYAKLYGMYEPKPNEKGKRNIFHPERGRYPLSDILAGKHRNTKHVTDALVKDKLIRGKILLPECSVCGYNNRRMTDKKMCLLLDHMDGDNRNYAIDNLRLLCFNCTFECGRGYIRRGKHAFDPDYIQGIDKSDMNTLSRW
jgi:5-methylcytosine-specific restriction endonuclease McrA